jgi:hypothetical protein
MAFKHPYETTIGQVTSSIRYLGFLDLLVLVYARQVAFIARREIRVWTIRKIE